MLLKKREKSTLKHITVGAKRKWRPIGCDVSKWISSLILPNSSTRSNLIYPTIFSFCFVSYVFVCYVVPNFSFLISKLNNFFPFFFLSMLGLQKAQKWLPTRLWKTICVSTKHTHTNISTIQLFECDSPNYYSLTFFY